MPTYSILFQGRRVACARVVAGPMEVARRPGITRRRHHGEANFGWAINARQLASRSQPASKGGFKRDGRCVSAHAAECGVPWGRKKAFEKPLPKFIHLIMGRNMGRKEKRAAKARVY